jgi:hypothetical protein
LHIFKDPHSTDNTMAKRYGKEVKGVCQICGSEGETQIHHIISRAKISRIKKGEHNHDRDLMKNPGNLSELCIPCHEQTDSHMYWRWYQKSSIKNEIQKSVQMGDANKEKFGYKGIPSASRKRTRRKRNQCKGVKPDGKRCGQKNRTIPKDGYCYSHKDQAQEGHSQFSLPDYKSSPPPGLHDEDDWEGDRFLDAEHIATLQDIHMFGVEPGEHELSLFSDWSEAWRRRWLYGEKW